MKNPGNGDPLGDAHRKRSNYIQEMVQNTGKTLKKCSENTVWPPKRIVQFWNDIDEMPADVRECIDSWAKLEKRGFEVHLFGENQAREFIRNRLGKRYEKAFDACYHPAMQSDYFRLCYIFTEGGCYVDADDVYRGNEIEHLLTDGRLKLQPLCYDISTNEMVPLSIFSSPGASSLNWIFYFNNNPLIAPRNHPIVERALLNATISLERHTSNQLPEIQSTTGPGNLTKTIFLYARDSCKIEEELLILYEWEEIAFTKWTISYRDDERNWRLSNRKVYINSQKLS